MIIHNEKQFGRQLDDAIQEGLRQAAENVAQAVVSTIPNTFKEVSGDLAKSVSTQENQGTSFTDARGRQVSVPNNEPRKAGPKSYEIEVSVSAPHAGAQELGSKAHDIPNAFGSGAAIQHPGTQGKHFLEDTVNQKLEDGTVKNIVAAGLQEHMKSIGGSAPNR